MHQLTSLYIAFSPCVSATVYLQSIYSCGYHSLCPIIKPPPLPPILFVSLSLYVFSYLFSLFTVHLFLYLQWLTGSGSVSGYQRKLRFCCRQIAFFLVSPVLFCSERKRQKCGSSKICLLLGLKNAPPLRIQWRVSHQTAGSNGTARLTHTIHR